METLGTIILPTVTAATLFDHELTGQFSDGMWENSGPWEHWKFWCRLEVKVDPTMCRVETTRGWECKKTGYNIASLYDVVGDRMVNMGRMSRACNRVLTSEEAYGCSHMPGTYAEWAALLKTDSYSLSITDEMARAFYVTDYTIKDLKSDVRVIKHAMKTMEGRR